MRLDKGEILKNMADKLGFSSSYLSAIEVGKRNIPNDLIVRLTDLYNLKPETVHALESAMVQQTKDISVELEGASFQQREMALLFARRFKELDEEITNKITQIFKKLPEEE
jgi:plasmid maintenance system antidote protein VapI